MANGCMRIVSPREAAPASSDDFSAASTVWANMNDCSERCQRMAAVWSHSSLESQDWTAVWVAPVVRDAGAIFGGRFGCCTAWVSGANTCAYSCRAANKPRQMAQVRRNRCMRGGASRLG